MHLSPLPCELQNLLQITFLRNKALALTVCVAGIAHREHTYRSCQKYKSLSTDCYLLGVDNKPGVQFVDNSGQTEHLRKFCVA